MLYRVRMGCTGMLNPVSGISVRRPPLIAAVTKYLIDGDKAGGQICNEVGPVVCEYVHAMIFIRNFYWGRYEIFPVFVVEFEDGSTITISLTMICGKTYVHPGDVSVAYMRFKPSDYGKQGKKIRRIILVGLLVRPDGSTYSFAGGGRSYKDMPDALCDSLGSESIYRINPYLIKPVHGAKCKDISPTNEIESYYNSVDDATTVKLYAAVKNVTNQIFTAYQYVQFVVYDYSDPEGADILSMPLDEKCCPMNYTCTDFKVYTGKQIERSGECTMFGVSSSQETQDGHLVFYFAFVKFSSDKISNACLAYDMWRRYTNSSFYPYCADYIAHRYFSSKWKDPDNWRH